MKLKEIITEATTQDYVGCDADSILAKAQNQATAHPRYSGIKKVILIAAALCLVIGSISAATLLSGFETAFGHKIDTGHVEVLSSSTDNPDVIWNITETWFDEYNLQIGGTVVTPEPLDPDGEYVALCQCNIAGEDESHWMVGYIFPTGENESAFFFRGGTTGHGDGTFSRIGFTEDETTVELKIFWMHDYSLIPTSEDESKTQIKDYVIYPGEWYFTVNLQSSDDAMLTWNGFCDSRYPNKSKATVSSVILNAFTMEIKGENLSYVYDTTDGTRESRLGIWLKLKDGTMIGKPSGVYFNENNYILHHRETEDGFIIIFGKAVDLDSVESLILFSDWMTIPDNSEEFLIREGYEYYPSMEEEEGRFEAWIPVMEIPLS